MIDCALDAQGLREQQARQRQLAPSVAHAARSGNAVLIDFEQDFDRRLLDEMLAVERRCCPFFRFAFDERARRLTIDVAQPEQAAAVDAIAEALGADAG